MSERKYRVYECINFDAAEIVIGVAPDDVSPRTLGDACAQPDWTAGQRVTFRIVEDALSLAAAAQFAISYSESDALKPFKVLIGPELPGVEA